MLSDHAIDILTEVINIGVGQAAACLSDMLEDRVALNVPTAHVLDRAEAEERLGTLDSEGTAILQEFRGGVDGQAALVFSDSSGLALAQLLSGSTETDAGLDLEMRGILVEVGNIVLNGVLGAMSNMITSQLEYSVPRFTDGVLANELLGIDDPERKKVEYIVMADAHLTVHRRDIRCSILIIFELGAVQRLIGVLGEAA